MCGYLVVLKTKRSNCWFRRCFTVNIMSRVTFNSPCLLWKHRTYGRKRMMNFWEENFLQDFPRDTGSIHLTSREFVSIDPCKHFTTLDREQLLTAHHLGWLLIDTESIFGIPLIRFEGKSIHAEWGGRRREKAARLAPPSAIGGRDRLYWIHGGTLFIPT